MSQTRSKYTPVKYIISYLILFKARSIYTENTDGILTTRRTSTNSLSYAAGKIPTGIAVLPKYPSEYLAKSHDMKSH